MSRRGLEPRTKEFNLGEATPLVAGGDTNSGGQGEVRAKSLRAEGSFVRGSERLRWGHFKDLGLGHRLPGHLDLPVGNAWSLLVQRLPAWLPSYWCNGIVSFPEDSGDIRAQPQKR